MTPGLIVRVDTDRLRRSVNVTTNAERTEAEDRAVTGAHPFLILTIERETGVVMMLPLYSRSAPGSAPLDPARLAGDGALISGPLFYSRWQHWRAPIAALATAIDRDEGAVRGTYAAGDVESLRELANWSSRNRCAFRPA